MTDRVVAFDAIGTLFDLSRPREEFIRLGAPPAALEAWFGRLLHTATSLTLIGRFSPFAEIAASSLGTTLAQLNLAPEQGQSVLSAMRELDAYPDAQPALTRLRAAGVGVFVVTNGSAQSTGALLERAGLIGLVQGRLSVEEVGAYKPHPEVYRALVRRAGVPADRVTLIAAHGWDVAGARAAGLDAIWIDRMEKLWPFPTERPARASGLTHAVELVLGRE